MSLVMIFYFLKEWMKATNVRLRLLRAKTLLGEYLPLAKGNPTVTRRVSIACCILQDKTRGLQKF